MGLQPCETLTGTHPYVFEKLEIRNNVKLFRDESDDNVILS
jgi:hypothetical protein